MSAAFCKMLPVETLNKFPLKTRPGRILLLDPGRIFYVEAERNDTVVRLAGRRLLHHLEPLDEVESRLRTPPFFRIHRSYLVNLERVAEIRARSKGEYEVRLEPPVNKVLPVSRNRYSGLRKLLGL